MLFEFDHTDVMCQDQHSVTARPEGRLYSTYSLSREHVDALDVEDGDNLFVLAHTDEFATTFVTPLKDNSKGPTWTLRSDVREKLKLSEGDTITTWITALKNIDGNEHDNPDSQGLPKKLTQLPLTEGSSVFSDDNVGSDPTDGTWLHIRKHEMKPVNDQDRDPNEPPRLQVKTTIYMNQPPYRKFLDVPPKGEVRVRAEFEGKSVVGRRNITEGGEGLTVSKEMKEELELGPHDEITLYIHTEDLAKKAPDAPAETDSQASQSSSEIDENTQSTSRDEEKQENTPQEENEDREERTTSPDSKTADPENSQLVLIFDDDGEYEEQLHYTVDDIDTGGETLCGKSFGENVIAHNPDLLVETKCAECEASCAEPLTPPHTKALLQEHTDAEFDDEETVTMTVSDASALLEVALTGDYGFTDALEG